MLHIEFAPMEGITGFPFRNAFAKIYGGISAYYTPFLTVNQNKKFGSHDIRDVDPEVNRWIRGANPEVNRSVRDANPEVNRWIREANPEVNRSVRDAHKKENQSVCDDAKGKQSIELIPQILTNKADQLAWGAEKLYELGYGEVNLNLGCPSPTVTKRHKGAGLLSDPEDVDQLLAGTFRILEADGCPVYISVKSRIGMQDKSRFDDLLRVYASYPLRRLVLHPRLGCQGYDGNVDLECFSEALRVLPCPVIYNGDLRKVEDVGAVRERFHRAAGIMIGRGLLYDPSLALKIQEGPDGEVVGQDLKGRLSLFVSFHETLLEEYIRANPYPDSCVPRMKELWSFWLENPDLLEVFGRETLRKMVKKIKKSRNLEDYRLAVRNLTDICQI